MTNIEAAKQLFVDGLDLIKNNEFEQAENKFLKSLKLNPDRESVLNNLSTVQIKLSKYKDAKKTSERVIQLNPKNVVAWMNLGIIEQELNNFDQSLADVIKVASIVEKEARTTETRKVIAGILWKRLELGISHIRLLP